VRSAMGVYVLGGKGKGTTMLDVLHSRPPKNAMFMFQHGNKSPDAREDSRKHTGNTGAGSTTDSIARLAFAAWPVRRSQFPLPLSVPEPWTPGKWGIRTCFPFHFCSAVASTPVIKFPCPEFISLRKHLPTDAPLHVILTRAP
jgi:hypothetical protein